MIGWLQITTAYNHVILANAGIQAVDSRLCGNDMREGWVDSRLCGIGMGCGRYALAGYVRNAKYNARRKMSRADGIAKIVQQFTKSSVYIP